LPGYNLESEYLLLNIQIFHFPKMLTSQKGENNYHPPVTLQIVHLF